ncbi:hypothetical protein J1614_003191 [Plenodomus biglobosus]|nr:hypothetical protein J1614_003191 [Plenodomus biglobosus]
MAVHPSPFHYQTQGKKGPKCFIAWQKMVDGRLERAQFCVDPGWAYSESADACRIVGVSEMANCADTCQLVSKTLIQQEDSNLRGWLQVARGFAAGDVGF